MRKLLFFILILLVNKTFTQNKQVLYDFAELPQTLLLNPASETNYSFHIGVPLLSSFSTEIGSTGFVLSDIFGVDNRNINDKIAAVINKLDTRDFLKFNSQIEILSGGFRLNDKTYISGGFYQEIDAIGYYPIDGLVFLTEGNNAFLNKSFSASQILYKLEVLGVLHAGITRKVNDKMTLGGRFKIYSSAVNLESKNNSGTLTTVEGTNNIYKHYLDNVNLNFRSAGLVRNDEFINDGSIFLNNTLLGGNLGMGFDVGITYQINPQLQFSGSILDFGFINYKKDIKNTKVNGSFIFEGIDFPIIQENSGETWSELSDRFKEELPVVEDQESYVSRRPTKLNAALKYSFGQRRSKVCYDNSHKEFYTDALGVQLFSIFRPQSPQLALTAFYQKTLSDKIHTKVTYTIDDFSYANLGAGLSAQFGKVNFYGMIDNILEYRNLSSANSVSLQLGINVIFN